MTTLYDFIATKYDNLVDVTTRRKTNNNNNNRKRRHFFRKESTSYVAPTIHELHTYIITPTMTNIIIQNKRHLIKYTY